jgi:hypothetical protein
MWPSRNKQGQLIGWVLDHNSAGGGVPFSAEEILVVEYVGEDDPVGVIEAVYAQVPLTDLVARHVGDVLTTGGRLAGMAWPKNRSLDEDEYQDVLRAWRNVASDPNAARRLLVFPEPMEFDKGAATPTELGIPELSALTRDEILTAFPISPYMLGVPMPHGLASGEQRREERHEYWEGTQHPRVEIWEDAIQQQLIGRYEKAVGRPLDMDIEEPNLDDAATLTEKATAYQSLVAIGFDAKDSVAAVGLDHIKWNGLPSSIDPVEKQKRAEQMAAQLAGRRRTRAGAGTAPDARERPRTAATAAATPSATSPAKARTLEQRAEVMDAELKGLHEAVHAALHRPARPPHPAHRGQPAQGQGGPHEGPARRLVGPQARAHGLPEGAPDGLPAPHPRCPGGRRQQRRPGRPADGRPADHGEAARVGRRCASTTSTRRPAARSSTP